MPSIGPSVFILGVVMVTVIAAQTLPAITEITTELNYQDSDMTSTIPESNLTSETTSETISETISYTTIATNNTDGITSEPTGSTMSANDVVTTMKMQKENESSESPTTWLKTTPKPLSTSQTTMSAATTKDNKTKEPVSAGKSDNIGIIILVVIIIVAVVFGIACYFARRRGRRHSVDFNFRPDESNIPLSTMQPELPADTAPQNGLQTFQSTESNAHSQEPEAKPLVQEEQKAEADKSVVDPSAESASADSSGDKPKEDVAEQSPPAPVEPNAEEKTDDEGIISNKTSVESLKETNENNSNNADVTQKKDRKLPGVFWEVSLDSPV